MRTTKLFVVLNEETLNTMKGFGGKTAKFETEEEADRVASESLDMWVVVKVHFTHRWLQHKVVKERELRGYEDEDDHQHTCEEESCRSLYSGDHNGGLCARCSD